MPVWTFAENLDPRGFDPRTVQSIASRYDIFLTAIGLTAGGSSTVHIYTRTIHRTTKLTELTRATLYTVYI